MLRFLPVVALSLVGATGALAAPCPAGRDKDVVKEAPELAKDERYGALFRAFSVRSRVNELVIDERHVKLTLVARRASPRAELPLALPGGAHGSVAVSLEVAAGACVEVDMVLFDGALRTVTVPAPRASLSGSVRSKGKAPVPVEIGAPGLMLTPVFMSLGDTRLYVGKGLPDPTALLVEDGGIDAYLDSLVSLGVTLGAADQARFDFLRLEQTWRRSLSTVLPRERQEQIGRIPEAKLPPTEAALLRFWRQQLGPASSPTDARARLLIDDAVEAVWVDGAEVYVRAPGASPSVEVSIGEGAVRVWIVSSEGGKPSTVHDTRAVLRKGELYSVAKTVVQHVGAGARRECLRVDGALPSKHKIYWRDLGTPPGPILGVEDAYRPPFDAAERTVTVVSTARSGSLFPPVPLVYSYTHPGTYRWRLLADGTVRLDLVEEDALCPLVIKDPLVRP